MLRRRVAVLTVLLAACTGGSGAADPTTTSTSTTTTTAPTTTTTIVITPAANPQDAATQFVTAWRNGDKPAALTIALPAAVDAAFVTGQPKSLENRGCNHPPANTPVLCVYRTDSGNEVQVHITHQPDGWVVDQVVVSPPTN